MVASCTGQGKHNNRSTRRGGSDSGSDFLTTKFSPSPQESDSTDVQTGARSRSVSSSDKAAMLQEQPSDVRAHNRAANGACDEYKQLKVLSMGRQKAVIKARREAKRVLRRDSRSHKQREEESVTSPCADEWRRSNWHGPRQP